MLQLLGGQRKVIQSGSVSYTFSAMGVQHIPVTITGVTDVSRVVERLLGYTFGTNEYHDAAIELVSPTQLMVHMRVNAAGTMTVDWDIVASDGKVQRGYVSMSTASNANATISAVDVGRAKAFNNGLYMPATGTNVGGYKTHSRVKIVNSTTVQINRSSVNSTLEARCYYAVEA